MPKQRVILPRSPEEKHWLMEVVKRKMRTKHFQEAVRPRRFSVISINCWGAEIYRELEIPYQSPFVNLYMPLPCFVGLLENFETAIHGSLEFIEESRHHGKLPFPIGLLMGKYEIHFMHYKSREEALEKWSRRCERIVPELDDCYFMIMHLGLPYVDELRRFDQLPFRNKVLFIDTPMPELASAVVVPPRTGSDEKEDGLTLYKRCRQFFNLPAWLNKEPRTAPPRARLESTV